MKYAFYILASGFIIYLFFSIKSCNGRDIVIAAANKNEDSLKVVIKTGDSAKSVQKFNYEARIDTLENHLAVEKFNAAKARTQFEATGGTIVQHNADYKAAKIVHDTVGRLNNCDSMSASVDIANAQYYEMQRQRDSVQAELEYVSRTKSKNIDTLYANAKKDSLQKQSLIHDYDVVKKEKPKGFWPEVIAIGAAVLEFVLLILK